jgi:hypothetical protein
MGQPTHFEIELIPEVAEPGQPVFILAKSGSADVAAPFARLVDSESDEETWKALLEPAPDGSFQGTFKSREPARYQLEVGLEESDAWDVTELIVASPGFADVAKQLSLARTARRHARFHQDRNDRAASSVQLEKAARLYEAAGKPDLAADVWIDLAELQMSRRPDQAFENAENAARLYQGLHDQANALYATQLAVAARLTQQRRFWQIGLDIQPAPGHCVILDTGSGQGLVLELGAGPSHGVRTGSAVRFRKSESFEMSGDRLAVVKLDDIVDTLNALPPELLASA